MKTASSTLYTIGKVFNIISIVLAVLAVIFAAVFLGTAPAVVEAATRDGITAFDTLKKVELFATLTLINSILALIVSCLVLFFANKATKALKKDDGSIAPHVIMLIIGVFGDIFYFLGSLFGLFYASKNK